MRYGVCLSDPFKRLPRKSLEHDQSTQVSNAARIAYTDCAARIKDLITLPSSVMSFLTPFIF